MKSLWPKFTDGTCAVCHQRWLYVSVGLMLKWQLMLEVGKVGDVFEDLWGWKIVRGATPVRDRIKEVLLGDRSRTQ
ncbi:MAG: hypothetical protein DSM106950_00350 [Stigonema ocellatum SAG 48.90 = DSM 106950]|nr:hypothetical protein [Stigonema ocellatum SAG 48.90 = DSM 106950]